jgi:hypothetical protein
MTASRELGGGPTAQPPPSPVAVALRRNPSTVQKQRPSASSPPCPALQPDPTPHRRSTPRPVSALLPRGRITHSHRGMLRTLRRTSLTQKLGERSLMFFSSAARLRLALCGAVANTGQHGSTQLNAGQCRSTGGNAAPHPLARVSGLPSRGLAGAWCVSRRGCSSAGSPAPAPGEGASHCS